MANKKINKQLRDTVFDFLVEMFQEARKETEESTKKEEYATWIEHYNNWIDLFNPFMNSLSEFDKCNSLLFLRFIELQKHLSLLNFNVLSGQYHQSIREIRYVLESAIQACYIDIEHPEATIEWKSREADKLYGSKLISNLDFKNDKKKMLKDLYHDLSQYIHSSYEELRPTIEKGEVSNRVTFAFNRDLFYKCIDFTNRTMDAFFFMILSLYPEMVQKIKNNRKLMLSLQESRYKLTSGKIRNVKAKQEVEKLTEGEK